MRPEAGSPGHRSQRRRIDRHFANRATPETEIEMRRHLPACEACRSYYDRRALLARLDPKAAPAEQRLAEGLGFGQVPRPRPTLAARFAPMLLVSAVATGLILYVGARQPSRGTLRGSPINDDAAFQSRGGRRLGASLRVYRVRDGRSVALGTEMAQTDELGFAYANADGYAHLLVVGVDEAHILYWYFPDPDVSDAALTIATTSDLRELPEVVRHAYRPGRLRIFGIFSKGPLAPSSIGPLVNRSGCAGLAERAEESACVVIDVKVGAKEGP